MKNELIELIQCSFFTLIHSSVSLYLQSVGSAVVGCRSVSVQSARAITKLQQTDWKNTHNFLWKNLVLFSKAGVEASSTSCLPVFVRLSN